MLGVSSEILEYHVVPGTLYTIGITRQEDLHTFEEADRLHLSRLGKYSREGWIQYSAQLFKPVIIELKFL